jgi:hypothetical protein
MKKTLFLALVSAALWGGCKKSDDPNPDTSTGKSPVITVKEISVPQDSAVVCGEPHNDVLRLEVGTTLKMTVHMQGSQELSQYKVNVHSNFDCHSHGRVVGVQGIEWQVSETVNISGSDTTVVVSLYVPENAATGNYDLLLRLLDISGREAEFVEYPLIVSDQGEVHEDDHDHDHEEEHLTQQMGNAITKPSL